MKLRVIKWYATWCAPCKALAPTWGRIVSEYKDRATFEEIDVEKHGRMSEQYQVRSVPTITVEMNGAVVARLLGNPPRAYQEIKKMLDHVLTTTK